MFPSGCGNCDTTIADSLSDNWQHRHQYDQSSVELCPSVDGVLPNRNECIARRRSRASNDGRDRTGRRNCLCDQFPILLASARCTFGTRIRLDNDYRKTCPPPASLACRRPGSSRVASSDSAWRKLYHGMALTCFFVTRYNARVLKSFTCQFPACTD